MTCRVTFYFQLFTSRLSPLIFNSSLCLLSSRPSFFSKFHPLLFFSHFLDSFSFPIFQSFLFLVSSVFFLIATFPPYLTLPTPSSYSPFTNNTTSCSTSTACFSCSRPSSLPHHCILIGLVYKPSRGPFRRRFTSGEHWGKVRKEGMRKVRLEDCWRKA